MKIIQKEILPEDFKEIREWRKLFDICKDEYDIQIGDILEFVEWDGEYTGLAESRKVSYILRNVPDSGLKEGYCIIGFDRSDPEAYRNPKSITVDELIGVLLRQDKRAIVLNGYKDNIRVYPGKENKSGGKNIIMIC